jgi:bifunctional non-homologous end joining protein LigD
MPRASRVDAHPRAPDPFGTLTGAERALLQPAAPPEWVQPMLATLTDRRFSDPRWIFERKLDGIRCLSLRDGATVRLLSRNQDRMNETFPEIAEAIAAEPASDFVVDGEIVAFEGTRTSFELLQQRSGITDPDRARRSPVKVRYYVFDIVHLEGRDLRALPLRARKRLLRSLTFGDPLTYTVHRNRDGERSFALACQRGWEGVMAKRADSPYVPRRSPDWLKFKCAHGQEFVIGGFTEPRGSRTGFGALLLGYYDDHGGLHYAGKVGTGFNEELLADLRVRLGRLEVDRSPFEGDRRFGRGAHFVRPELVAEVGFAEWTREGLLRQPRFQGLRPDKPAGEVFRERPR